MNLDQEPVTYGFVKVTFGDRPAGAICAAALRETAEVYSHIDEDAAEKIKDDSYCDDVVTGDDTRERIDELKESIPEIIGKGGFEIKGFVTNGDTSAESRKLLGTGEMGRVLGVSWDPGNDEYSFTVRVNLSKKYKGDRSEPDLTYDEIPRILTMKVTRRILLGIVNSCYDVYGFLAPLLIQLKIELRNLFSKELNLGWDDPISDSLKQRWMGMLQLLKSAEAVRFPRRIQPDGTVGDPLLVMCNDESRDAMCCTAHVRWQLRNGEFESRLSNLDDPKPLTPNDLLLGQTTGEVPQGPFDSNKSITRRFRFLQQIITDWWDQWYSVALPTLVPWLQRHRNVQVDDVCLIR